MVFVTEHNLPYFPQRNGQAGHCVKIIKSFLLKVWNKAIKKCLSQFYFDLVIEFQFTQLPYNTAFAKLLLGKILCTIFDILIPDIRKTVLIK